MSGVSFCIQHHPRRSYLLAPLIGSLTPGPPPQVVFDPDPDSPIRSSWRTYRRALETTPPWATHRLVLQDDVEVCRSFPVAAQRAIAARPDALVVFCVCGDPTRWAQRVRYAASLGNPWAELDIAYWESWIPTVAVSWPVAAIAPALEFVDAQDWPPSFTADDEIVGRIARHIGIDVWATAPSLVEHPDLHESAISRRSSWGGVNPGRLAACYIGDCDALTIDWATGAA